MVLKEKIKDFWNEIKEKCASDGDRRIRNFHDFVEVLKQNLFALEEDPETGKKKMTPDTVRVWINHGLSTVIGLVAGLGTYWYIGGKFVYFRHQMFLYQTGSLTLPPSSLWFVVCIIWCSAMALAISAIAGGVVHLISNLFVIRRLEYKHDIRLTGIAISCIVYVFLILFCVVVHLPVLSYYVTKI